LELLCLTMLYLVAKPSHMEADLDGLAYYLHRPTVCSRQWGGQSFLTSTAPSRHVAVGGGVFSGGGGAKLLGLDILRGVHCSGTCKTEFYMEKLAFTRACLADVRVIMVIMRVPLVESLY
jgi:hypothetical protein